MTLTPDALAFTRVWLMACIAVVALVSAVLIVAEAISARRRRRRDAVTRHPSAYVRPTPPIGPAAGSSAHYRPRGLSMPGHAALAAYAGRHRRGA